MPLTFANPGEKYTLLKIKGKEEEKNFLTGLGFTEGVDIDVVSRLDKSLIVNVRGARVALGTDMAKKLMVSGS
ncbi:MAG: FeoA family protein [Lachnospiraceae bacterium]|jgi:ferrous iron transport protein A|nr:FeoA family protein [Lachnospiraceae bacterium]MEE3461974.1 FeoA family protein [Lachnospiraceae bacterium]